MDVMTRETTSKAAYKISKKHENNIYETIYNEAYSSIMKTIMKEAKLGNFETSNISLHNLSSTARNIVIDDEIMRMNYGFVVKRLSHTLIELGYDVKIILGKDYSIKAQWKKVHENN